MDESMGTLWNDLDEMSIQLNNTGADLLNLDTADCNFAMITKLFKESISAMLESSQLSTYDEEEKIKAQLQFFSEEITIKRRHMIQTGSAAVESALETVVSSSDASADVSTRRESKRNLVGCLHNMMYCSHGKSHNPVLCMKGTAPTYLTTAFTITVDSAPFDSLDQSPTVLYNTGLVLLHQAAKISSRGDAKQEKQCSALLSAAETMFEASLNNGNHKNENDKSLYDSDAETLEGQHFPHNLEEKIFQSSIVAVYSLNNLAFIKHQRQLFDDAIEFYHEALKKVQDSRDYLPAHEFECIRLAILCNLACSYQEQGNSFDAIQICSKALHLMLQREKEEKLRVEKQKQQEVEKEFAAFTESAVSCLLYKLGLLHKADRDFSQASEYFKHYICRTMSRTCTEEQGRSSQILYNSLDVVLGLNHFLIIQEIEKSNPDSELSLAVKMVQRQWSEGKFEAPDLPPLLLQIGVFLYESRQYDFSLHYFQEALRIERVILGPFHVGHVRTLNNVGQSYQLMGMHCDAMKHYNEALEVLERCSSDRAYKSSAVQLKWMKLIPVIHYNMGVVQLEQLDHNKAIENFEKALALQGSMMQDNDLCVSSYYQITSDYATMCYNIGTSLLEIGKIGQSLKCFEQSHRIRWSMYGSTHILVSEPLYQIGKIYQLMGDPTQALRFLKEVARVEQAILGPHDPELAMTLYCIAQIYHHQGELSSALKVYGHVLSTVRSAISLLDSAERASNDLPPELMPFNIILTMANINVILRRLEDARSLLMEAAQLSSNDIAGTIPFLSNKAIQLMAGKFTIAKAA